MTSATKADLRGTTATMSRAGDLVPARTRRAVREYLVAHSTLGEIDDVFADEGLGRQVTVARLVKGERRGADRGVLRRDRLDERRVGRTGPASLRSGAGARPGQPARSGRLRATVPPVGAGRIRCRFDAKLILRELGEEHSPTADMPSLVRQA